MRNAQCMQKLRATDLQSCSQLKSTFDLQCLRVIHGLVGAPLACRQALL